MEAEDKFAILIREISKGFSWRLITQIVIIALLGIPILKLYEYFFPIFPPPLPPPSISYILVPANKLWINSGITIQPGQKITMRASGYINLAIHRLISSANTDVLPPYSWSDTTGTVLDGTRPLYKRREELLIEKRALLGQLLYVAVRDSEVPPSQNNPRPERIRILKSGDCYKNESKVRETFYFTVNEKLVENSQKARLAFIGKNQKEVDDTYGSGVITRKQLEERFNKIIEQGYWTVWFDDNIGQFLVEIK
ncbi:hypothetical protein VU04_01385 [Desulfobulbus sp. TB]|nr:hypothetical protein [Desulfobulbus sp. TB]